MPSSVKNEQLTRFIAAYQKAHKLTGQAGDMFHQAVLVSSKIPPADHEAVNRHLIALFDRTGGQKEHWQLIHDELERLEAPERKGYLARLARDTAYSPKEVIPYAEFLDLSYHAVHDVHFAKTKRR